MMAARRAALCGLALLLAMQQAAGRTYSVGDLVIPGGNRAASLALSSSCAASSTADFQWRLTLAQYPASWVPTTSASNSSGPYLNFYPLVNASQVPPTCHPTAWAWQRLRAAISLTISMGMNYCHHRAPAYLAPNNTRILCLPDTDVAGCVCNQEGMNKTLPWNGLDCSNFAAWLLNFAFGYYPSTAVGDQACDPTLAPGRLLHNVSAANATWSLSALLPGDLLFITGSRTTNKAPTRVSHVEVFTGYTVDFNNASSPFFNATLLGNVPASQHSTYIKCMKNQLAVGRPVYVIADSTHAGPALRPFCGWSMTAFSHARRVIDPNTAAYPKTNDASIAYFNATSGTSGDCMSWWKLSSA